MRPSLFRQALTATAYCTNEDVLVLCSPWRCGGAARLHHGTVMHNTTLSLPDGNSSCPPCRTSASRHRCEVLVGFCNGRSRPGCDTTLWWRADLSLSFFANTLVCTFMLACVDLHRESSRCRHCRLCMPCCVARAAHTPPTCQCISAWPPSYYIRQLLVRQTRALPRSRICR